MNEIKKFGLNNLMLKSRPFYYSSSSWCEQHIIMPTVEVHLLVVKLTQISMVYQEINVLVIHCLGSIWNNHLETTRDIVIGCITVVLEVKILYDTLDNICRLCIQFLNDTAVQNLQNSGQDRTVFI